MYDESDTADVEEIAPDTAPTTVLLYRMDLAAALLNTLDDERLRTELAYLLGEFWHGQADLIVERTGIDVRPMPGVDFPAN